MHGWVYILFRPLIISWTPEPHADRPGYIFFYRQLPSVFTEQY